MKLQIIENLKKLTSIQIVRIINETTLFSDRFERRYTSIKDLLEEEFSLGLLPLDIVDNSLPLDFACWYYIEYNPTWKIKGTDEWNADVTISELADLLEYLFLDSEWLSYISDDKLMLSVYNDKNEED